MATTPEVNIGSEGNGSEFHNKPLYEKQARGAVIDSAMRQYDAVVGSTTPRTPLAEEISMEEARRLAREQFDKMRAGEIKVAMGGSRLYKKQFGDNEVENKPENKAENDLVLDKMDKLDALQKSLGSKGFLFEDGDENIGIKMKSEGAKTVVIGKGADLDAQIVFLEALDSNPDYQKEELGDILNPVQTAEESVQEESILNKPPVEPQVESMEELLGSNQLDEAEKIADNVEQTTQNPEKERILQELSSIRSELAEMDALTHNYSGKTGKSFFALKDEYNSKKEELLKQIGAEIRGGEVYGPLTPEQEKLVKSKFDDELYKVLKSENDSYNASIKAVRGESILDKAKENFRDLLGTKGIKWYVGLSRTKRIAINTALFSVIAAGVAFAAPTGTAGAAISAGGYRLARGVGAFAGSGLGMWGSNKILKPEQLQEWKTQEEQKIKESEDSVEEKSRKIEELEKEFDRRLRNLNLKKIGMAALAGGITGAVTGAVTGGIFDHYYNGSGGSNTVENLRKGANVKEHLGGVKAAPSESAVPEASQPEVPEGVTKESTNLNESGEAVGTTEVVDPESLKEIFGENYKEATLQDVAKGDSLWGVTREALLNNERFAALSVGQKNNILAYYSNKILNSPEKFGFEAHPKYGIKLEVGKPIDLSKAFDDEVEFEKVLSRAEKMSPELEAQEVQRATEIENSYKVKDAISPDTSIKANVPDVSEIENPKFSNTESSPVANKGVFSETERAAFMGSSLEKIDKISEKINQLKGLGVDLDRIKVLEDKILELKNSVNYVKDNYTGPNGRVDLVDDVLGTSKKIDGLQKEVEKFIEEEIRNKSGAAQDIEIPQRQELENEIKAARERLEEIEKSSKIVQMPSKRGIIEADSLRTMKGDTNNIIQMVNRGGELSNLDNAVEKAFYDEVQNVYGKDGLMGIGRVVGVNSKDWGLVKGLSANEVIKYFTDNSTETNLPPNIVSELTKSAKHQAFGKQLLGLIDMTDGNVKPYENENVMDFTKRLGKFVMEKHSQGISNIKTPMKMAA